MYEIFLNDVSKSRNIPSADLKKYANDLMIRSAEDAVTYKLVDTKGYWDEFQADLRQRMGLGEKDKVNSISIEKYYKSVKKDKDYSACVMLALFTGCRIGELTNLKKNQFKNLRESLKDIEFVLYDELLERLKNLSVKEISDL